MIRDISGLVVPGVPSVHRCGECWPLVLTCPQDPHRAGEAGLAETGHGRAF